MHNEGGCLCGELRYAVNAAPIDAAYCHCRMCQRSTGAPVLAWASFRREHFKYTRGAPAVYRSSAEGMREFCSRCGTQIAFRVARQPESMDVNLGSLDDPTLFPPEYHIWCASRIDWFDTADTLPRYDDDGADR